MCYSIKVSTLSLLYFQITLPLVTNPNPMALGYKTHPSSATVIGPEMIISVKQGLQKPSLDLCSRELAVKCLLSFLGCLRLHGHEPKTMCSCGFNLAWAAGLRESSQQAERNTYKRERERFSTIFNFYEPLSQFHLSIIQQQKPVQIPRFFELVCRASVHQKLV